MTEVEAVLKMTEGKHLSGGGALIALEMLLQAIRREVARDGK